jgi:hypothetical protein
MHPAAILLPRHNLNLPLKLAANTAEAHCRLCASDAVCLQCIYLLIGAPIAAAGRSGGARPSLSSTRVRRRRYTCGSGTRSRKASWHSTSTAGRASERSLQLSAAPPAAGSGRLVAGTRQQLAWQRAAVAAATAAGWRSRGASAGSICCSQAPRDAQRPGASQSRPAQRRQGDVSASGGATAAGAGLLPGRYYSLELFFGQLFATYWQRMHDNGIGVLGIGGR